MAMFVFGGNPAAFQKLGCKSSKKACGRLGSILLLRTLIFVLLLVSDWDEASA